MKNNYLNKVLDQIVSETNIDYEEGRLYTPFTFPYPFSYFPSSSSFSSHCKNIYGLNEDEVKYVWKKYKEIIKDKLS